MVWIILAALEIYNICITYIYIIYIIYLHILNISKTAKMGFPCNLVGKESACSAGDTGDAGSVLESGQFPGEGNGNLLQYSCLRNPMDRGAWQATVHGVTKSQTQLKWLSTSIYICLSFETQVIWDTKRHDLFSLPAKLGKAICNCTWPTDNL